MTATCTVPKTPCPAVERGAGPAGFTLIELMVTVAVIGLALTVMVTGSTTLLPQARLRAQVDELAADLEQVRSWALLKHESMLFAYDFERGGYEAYYPHERDERGEVLGPGKFPVLDFKPFAEGTALRFVRLPGSVPRDGGVVTLEVSALGRVPPHELVVENPDYPETEVFTLRVNGLSNRSEVVAGDVPSPLVNDVDFQ